MPSPGLREQIYSLLSKTIVSMKNTEVYYRAYTNTLQRHNYLISQVSVGHHFFFLTISLGIREDSALYFQVLVAVGHLFLRGLWHARWIGCSVIFCFNEVALLPWRRTAQCCAVMQSTSAAIKCRVSPCIFLPLYPPPLTLITLYESKRR